MNTKKFIAVDMRQALKQVRDELGADAVILANRKLPEGVEIVAATDYDSYLEQQRNQARKKRQLADCMDDSAVSPQPGDAARMIAEKPDHADALKRREQANQKFNEAWLQQLEQQKINSDTLASAELKAIDSESMSIHEEPTVELSARARSAAATTELEPVVESIQTKRRVEDDSSQQELAAMRGELSQLRQLLNVQMINAAWGSYSQGHPLEALMFKRLSRLGLSPEFSRKLIRNIQPNADLKLAWAACLRELSEDLPLLPTDVVANGGIFAFVGTAGVGKTTTIAKIATRYVLEHGAENLALVTTDSYRIAGHEQLCTLGRILDVPVRVVTEQQSLPQILANLSRKQLILIDTAGLSHKDQTHHEQMELLNTLGSEVQRWLVLSATSQRRILDKAIAEYKHLNLAGCVLTKLDESASLGEALSVAVEAQLPIGYVTDGQNIPDDIARPHASRLVNHTIALAKENHLDDVMVADLYREAISTSDMELAYG